MGAIDRREVLIGSGAAIVAGSMSLAGCAQRPPNGTAGSAPKLDPAYRSAGDLSAALKTGRISSVELVDNVIARIERFDPKLNAVVVRDFERARTAAKTADTALRSGDRRPLLGVPVTIKESFNVAGLATTWGIPQFKDFVAKDDALIVARLKSAGAIVVGKTNVPIVLADMQSYNAIYGTTNNPWNVGRTPGGSSGGSSAALAAGFGPLSLGSDIGGSLRTPAHFCGVFSHKPSLNLVPVRGHNPPPFAPLPREGDLDVVGPMARSAADLLLALELIAGPDEFTAGVGYRLALPAARHTSLDKFRVLVLDAHPLIPTSNAVRAALNQLFERLAKAGVALRRESPQLPDLATDARLYMRILLAALSAGLPPDAFAHAQSVAAALSADDRSLAAERARGTVLSHRDWLFADGARRRLREQWRMLFREIDVVLCPTTPTVAFAHDHSPPNTRRLAIDGREYPYYDVNLVWPALATLPGLPATVMPAARSDDGLPIGVQIIGPFLEDRTTLAFAALVEREFGGFVPPPGYA
jgi:amidase